MIAKIAVSAAVYAIDKPYDYQIPEKMELQPGMRVMVPFGKGNRRCEGIVLSLQEGADRTLKSVECALDVQPVMDEKMLHVAAFLRDRYFCTFYDAVKAILPAGLWFRVQCRYALKDPMDRQRLETLTDETESAVCRVIVALGGQAEESALKDQFQDEAALQRALKRLVHKGILITHMQMHRKVQDKREQVVTLLVSGEEALEYANRKRKSAPLQYAVLELLVAIGAGTVKEICYFTGASTATFRRLEQLGLVSLSQQEVLRCTEIQPADVDVNLKLNEMQQRAFDGLAEKMRLQVPGVCLLHGVTGSGKTAVYIKLVYEALREGKSALLLVPEIALTPQLLQLFTAHFGKKVAVLHSSLRISERYDQWKRIRAGDATVVLGTRSAVFAPLKQLGIIIVDEEQEHTYKSENTPRYHAREVAIYRGLKEHALVLLGSATPSVESMYQAKAGHYDLFSITQRYNEMELPAVEIVDMKQELRHGNGSSLSECLKSSISAQQETGQQTILFLNRRGNSRMVVCVDCGYVPECPRCSVSLTYHSANHRMMCHYCGHSEPAQVLCPECGGHMKTIGVGTQKVQKELETFFPQMPIIRMDADTVTAMNTHERILGKFQKARAAVLVGTQMVTKGLNFENVTLVGVLDADMSLYVDHFRAGENTFSMLTQVVGRAGRGGQKGKAIIQTMTPENPVIQLAAAQDYMQFYEAEIRMRRLRQYPPFSDLFTITFSGCMEDDVMRRASLFRAELEAALCTPLYRAVKMEIFGPAPASVAKVNNCYRIRLTLQCKNTKEIRQLLGHLLRVFVRDKSGKGVHIYADVNCYD